MTRELRPSRRLPELVPGLYLARAPAGRPDAPGRELRALLGVLGASLDELYDAVTGLWDDHFVERADPAALPLHAELFAARLVSADPRAQRALLARIVGWRRRKGTLATLEEALTLTSGWDVEADEGFRSLIHAQDLAHPAPWRVTTAVAWDPIGIADPLSRRAPDDHPSAARSRQRRAVVARLPWETVDDTLRRLGRVDAGRNAASPRTVDLRGWARPDAVVLRASQLHPIDVTRFAATPAAPAPVDATGAQRLHVDPLRRDTPLAWLEPVVAPDLFVTDTARHEPSTETTLGRAGARLLTPSALADDPARAEGCGAIEVAIEGVPVVGPPRPIVDRGPMPAGVGGPRPVLELSEIGRVSPGDTWTVRVVAAEGDEDEPAATDLPLLTGSITVDGAGVVAAPTTAAALPAGRVVELIVERSAGRARRRAADGTWSDLDVDTPLGPPVSNVAAVAVAAATWIVRVERDLATGTNRLTRFALAPGARWEAFGVLPPPLLHAVGIAAIGDAGGLLLVATADDRLGVWRVVDLDGAITVTRVDDLGGRAPIPRSSPSLAIHAGRLYAYGGDRTRAAGDLWSIATGGGAWTPHALHGQRDRMGAALVSSAIGLVLIGGDDVPGELEVGVLVWDPATSRSWRKLPSLPIEPGRPGVVVVRATAGGVEAIAWADRNRPQRLTLAFGASHWEVGEVERRAGGVASGANPPGLGEACFVEDALLIVAPPPLPPSELLFVLDGRGRLAFLPYLDVAPGRSVRLRVFADGGTLERARSTDVAPPPPLDHRTAAWRAGELRRASGGELRLAVPGRLTRTPWTVRQRDLEPWEQLVVDGEPCVAVDPRLGRVALPPGAPLGRVTITTRIGRPARIGPGCAPIAEALPAAWLEPDAGFEPWPTPPPPTVAIDPGRAGATIRGHGGAAVPVVASIDDAVAAGADRVSLALLDSIHVAPARITAGLDRGFALVAAERLGLPVIAADPERGVSLALHAEELGAAPRMYLRGLWLTGRLELVLGAGQVEARYCELGQPGQVALWIPGAGHQDLAARRSLPEATVQVRLYGCRVGCVELPPWVSLVAAGCTFDAGDRDAPAIRAAGARVRLRHCTIYGAVEAGELGSSSCVHAGPVRVDRPDRGFVRHGVLARGGEPPAAFASRVHVAGFVSNRPTDPGYLVLSSNNGDVLTLGEDGSQPGAYAERAGQARELAARTNEFLPIGMASVLVDRTTHDLYRLSRR